MKLLLSFMTATLVIAIWAANVVGNVNADTIKPESKPVNSIASETESTTTVTTKAEESITTTPSEEVTPPTATQSISFSNEEIDVVAKVLYGEANCVESDAERSMVIWTILNRLDAKMYGDETIAEVCTRPYQFAYDAEAPVTDRNRELVVDVFKRWSREKAGETKVGRTLPKEYLFFLADSDPESGIWHNHFCTIVDGERVSFGYENPLENPYTN